MLGVRSLRHYLQFLLHRYQMSIFNNEFPKNQKLKTRYQGTGRQLLRIGIRASNRDWIVLSEISLGLGYSRCCVFVLLLELDLGILKEIERVLTPRLNEDRKIIPYAIVVTQIIYPMGDIYQKRLRLYELSRMRDPIVRECPGYFNRDGSLKRTWGHQ